MMRRTTLKTSFLTLISLSFFLAAWAQRSTLTWGTANKSAGWKQIYAIQGNEKMGYYAIETDFSKQSNIGGDPVNPYKNSNVPTDVIFHYGADLGLKKSRKMELGEKGKRRNLEKLIISEDRLFLFSSLLHMKSKTHKLFVEEIDPVSLENVSEARLLSTISFPKSKTQFLGGLAYRAFEKSLLVGAFSIQFNSDSSKLLVSAYGVSPDGKAENNDGTFGEYIMFDTKMEELWRTKRNVFSPKAYAGSSALGVDKRGNLYLFSHNLTREERKAQYKSKKKSFTYSFYIYDAAEKRSIVHNKIFETGDRKLKYFAPILNEQDELIVLGTFTRYDKWEFAEKPMGGTFYFKMDLNTQKIITEKIEEFTIETMAKGMGVKAEKLLKKKLENKIVEVDDMRYSPGLVVDRNEGKSTLIIQGTSSHSVQNSASGNYTSVRYSKIWVINFDSDGNQMWTEFISKDQRTNAEASNYSSYTLAEEPNGLNFVFNDNSKNTNANAGKGSASLKHMRGSGIAVVRVDDTGKMRKEFIDTKKDSKIALISGVNTQNEKGELIFIGQVLRNRKIGKITFP